MIDLLSLTEKADKATKGTWKRHPYNQRMGSMISFGDISKGETVAIVMAQVDPKEGEANAEFIEAASPETILSLCSELSAARERETPEQAFERGQVVAHERITKHNPTVFLYGTKPYFPPTGGTH